MGKDQELLQAVKTEDLLTAQRLLQRPRAGKASEFHPTPSLTGSLTHILGRVAHALTHTHTGPGVLTHRPSTSWQTVVHGVANLMSNRWS